MLTMRLIGVRDYSVFEDGQHIGRIRFASERTPGVWLWHVQVQIPGPPFGSTANLDDAKQSFKAAWLAFKQRHWAGSTRGGLSRGEQAQRTMTVPRGFIEPCQPSKVDRPPSGHHVRFRRHGDAGPGARDLGAGAGVSNV